MTKIYKIILGRLIFQLFRCQKQNEPSRPPRLPMSGAVAQLTANHLSVVVLRSQLSANHSIHLLAVQYFQLSTNQVNHFVIARAKAIL